MCILSFLSNKFQQNKTDAKYVEMVDCWENYARSSRASFLVAAKTSKSIPHTQIA